jgi:hypothetical protein
MIFQKAGILIPPGFEDLANENDIVESLFVLKEQHPLLKKAMIKMNDGFSGEGNAVFSYNGAPEEPILKNWIKTQLRNMHIIAPDLNYRTFMKKFTRMQGIVEAFIDGDIKASPSVQCRVNPLGEIDIISTHDQVMGGPDDQVFLGGTFPANADYAVEVGQLGKKISEAMRDRGVLGRFGVDFISIQENGHWKHYAIEINLRKGGTTHPLLMLQFLTDGRYNEETGEYHTAGGHKRYYFASDNVYNEKYKGLTPDDLIDISIYHDLFFDSATKEGIMFHLVGALSEYGKFGVLCVGSSPEKAREFYHKIIRVLDLECE